MGRSSGAVPNFNLFKACERRLASAGYSIPFGSRCRRGRDGTLVVSVLRNGTPDGEREVGIVGGKWVIRRP